MGMSQQLQTDNTSANMDTDQQAPSDPGQPSSATTAPQHPLPATAVALSSVVKKLPQSYPFKGSSYYVRKCYEKYYGYMNDALENKYKIITVTGTPGIGKSVFYLYFEKYRKANPKKTIVTASFYKTRKLKECKVYEPGKEGVLINEVPKDLEDAIRLYDGPPEGEPLRAQMVTFTSPNHEWLKDALKKSNERRLFMPFWSLEELLEANKALKLKLADAEIERRFELFGGSARMCLQLDESNVKGQEDALTAAIKRLIPTRKSKIIWTSARKRKIFPTSYSSTLLIGIRIHMFLGLRILSFVPKKSQTGFMRTSRISLRRKCKS